MPGSLTTPSASACNLSTRCSALTLLGPASLRDRPFFWRRNGGMDNTIHRCLVSVDRLYLCRHNAAD